MSQLERVNEARLFTQIATRVRHRIAAGQLIPGDRLPSLRQAAKEWGVNLHTVRRAYSVLEAEELVERVDRRRTVVAKTTALPSSPHTGDLDAYLTWVAETAHARFGLPRYELARRLAAERADPDLPIWVLECSPSLANSLAACVSAWARRTARPWLVSRARELPDGYYLGTYYHFAQVRAALAGRRHAPAFFAVRFESAFLRRLRSRASKACRLVVLAVEPRSGRALLTDVVQAIGPRVDVTLRTTRNPRTTLAQIPSGTPVLISPENWDCLTPEERDVPDRFELVLEPIDSDLARIGAAFGWQSAAAHDRPRRRR
jgi:DNA-binding transcriptional regulator YhcF (GntR family)